MCAARQRSAAIRCTLYLKPDDHQLINGDIAAELSPSRMALDKLRCFGWNQGLCMLGSSSSKTPGPSLFLPLADYNPHAASLLARFLSLWTFHTHRDSLVFEPIWTVASFIPSAGRRVPATCLSSSLWFPCHIWGTYLHIETFPLMNDVSVLTILKYINNASFELVRRSCASFWLCPILGLRGSSPAFIISERCLLKHQLLEVISSRESSNIKFTTLFSAKFLNGIVWWCWTHFKECLHGNSLASRIDMFISDVEAGFHSPSLCTLYHQCVRKILHQNIRPKRVLVWRWLHGFRDRLYNCLDRYPLCCYGRHIFDRGHDIRAFLGCNYTWVPQPGISVPQACHSKPDSFLGGDDGCEIFFFGPIQTSDWSNAPAHSILVDCGDL